MGLSIIEIRRLPVCATSLVAVFMIYYYFNLYEFSYYTNKPWRPVRTCRNTDQEIDQLIDLTWHIHRILNKMNIRHWLMYGSIWGARRIGRPLPWDNDVDIGFDGDGTFSKLTINEFMAPFQADGLQVQDTWLQRGSIHILRKDLWLKVDLFAFYNYGGTMKRRGLESWIFAVNYHTYHEFPAWLVAPELPKAQFGSYNMSIPKGGIEILKHLYPYNWWKEARPVGC